MGCTLPGQISFEQVKKGKGQTAGMWLVKRGDAILGLLEKYNNTRTDMHPWKAYKGHGPNAKFIGAFYAEDGGKKAAVEAILS